jgi:hypothetical protein
VIVLLYQEYFVLFKTSEVKFYKNSICAKIGFTEVDIFLGVINEKDVIDIILQCPTNIDDFSEAWKIWNKLCNAMEKLKETWWDEIFSDKYFMCRHCQMINPVDVWHIPVDTAEEPSLLPIVKCTRTNDDIPSLLIHQPPENDKGILDNLYKILLI